MGDSTASKNLSPSAPGSSVKKGANSLSSHASKDASFDLHAGGVVTDAAANELSGGGAGEFPDAATGQGMAAVLNQDAVFVDGTLVAAEDLAEDRTVISRRPPERVSASGTQDSAELGRLLAGQRLGHFELEQFVGGGGMGAVFRGTDTMLGRTVAVKVLARHHAEDEETTRRFRNEAQSAARLDHENIARVYYVGIDRGWHYLVLEYIDGHNLRDLVFERGPLPLAQVVNYTSQVAEALAHASSRDVVHRDIKPSNVLVTQDDHIKLVDMGLARLRQVEHSSDDLTASGVTLGTFDYISPEQARDPRAADVRSDLYSLGCTMYFMLCGRPPFPDGTVLQKLLQHQGDEAPDVRQFRSDVPDAMLDVLRKLLAKNPQQRYQHPAELNADLLVLCDQLGLAPPAGRTTVMVASPLPPATWAERHLPWVVPVCLLGIAVAAIQIYGNRASDIGPRPLRPAVADSKVNALTSIGSSLTRGADVKTNTGSQSAGGDSRLGGGRSTSSRQGKSPSHGTSLTVVRKDNSKGSGTDPSPAGPSQGSAGDSAAGSNTRSADMAPGQVVDAGMNSSEPATSTEPRGPSDGMAGSGATNPSETGASVPVSAPYVAVVNGAERRFNTLSEACRQARSGSVIELRFNGERDERPMVLSNRELTLRAGEGFRPIVRFRPDVSDPVIYPRSMLTVSGGELRLFNVELQLQIPQMVRSDGWTLIEAVEADKVRLEHCTLTIANGQEDGDSYRQGVSFFSVHLGPHRESAMMTPDAGISDARVNLELRDCVVRGEANLLSGDGLQLVSLQWENGLLATSERLVNVVGSRSANTAAGQLRIDLQHVTAQMRRGMCLITTGEDERFLPAVRLSCTDSILMTDGSPLIEQRGDESVNEQKKRLFWRGNGNMYAGIDVFWRIESTQTTAATQYDWFAWQDQWGRGREIAQRGGTEIFQRLPDRQRPLSTHTPADYALDEKSPDNSARGTATDGNSDIGLKPELLPARHLPSETPPRDPQPSGAGAVQ